MKLLKYSLFFIIISCNTKIKNSSGSKKSNNKVDLKTNIVLTLNDSINVTKNQLFTPSLVCAWLKVREEFNNNVNVKNNNALKTLNTTLHYKNALPDSIVKTTIAKTANKLNVSSEFSLILPFKVAYKKNILPIYFNDTLVQSFGSKDVLNYEEHDDFNSEESQIKNSELLYYKDSTNFGLQLNPKNTNYQIQLFKLPIKKSKTLQQLLRRVNKNIKNTDLLRKKVDSFSIAYESEYLKKLLKQGISFEQVKDLYLRKNDVFAIPSLAFSVTQDYPQLVGAVFNDTFKINEAQQTINFQLNENGSKINSKSSIEVVSVGKTIQPKTLLFNRNFLIVVKLKKTKNPCFVGWIANTSAMKTL